MRKPPKALDAIADKVLAFRPKPNGRRIMNKKIKEFDGPARDPQSQFQINDMVVYLPEGVYTMIEGYLWIESIGSLPRIAAYRLTCGICAPENSITHRNTLK